MTNAEIRNKPETRIPGEEIVERRQEMQEIWLLSFLSYLPTPLLRISDFPTLKAHFSSNDGQGIRKRNVRNARLPVLNVAGMEWPRGPRTIDGTFLDSTPEDFPRAIQIGSPSAELACWRPSGSSAVPTLVGSESSDGLELSRHHWGGSLVAPKERKEPLAPAGTLVVPDGLA